MSVASIVAGFRLKIEVVQQFKAKIKIFMSGSAELAAFPKPPKPFYNTSIVFKVCHAVVKQTKRPKRAAAEPEEVPEEDVTECWPGVCYFGGWPAAMFWMGGDTTPYDGKPCYTLTDLTADRAAGERIVVAIRTKQQFTSSDKHLNRALEHVYAAVHQGQPMEDWLEWMLSILPKPMAPLNSRGQACQQHRGQGKATPLNRAAFVAKLHSGLTRREEASLWFAYKQRHAK